MIWKNIFLYHLFPVVKTGITFEITFYIIRIVSMAENYIQSNHLLDRFEVASVDKIWSIDATKFSFTNSSKKLSVLFIVDLCSRKILKTLITKSEFKTGTIITALEELLVHVPQGTKRLIIHTDRASLFTCPRWDRFGQAWKEKIVLSMSDQACPFQNAVSERINHTIKNCFFQAPIFIKNQNLKLHIEQLPRGSKTPLQDLKKIIESVVDYYNNNHINRMLQCTAEEADQIYRYSKVGEPPVIAVRNNGTSPVEHQLSVSIYKNNLLIRSMEEAGGIADPKHEPLLLHHIQKAIFLENKKLAKLTQAQFQVLSNKLDSLAESFKEFSHPRRKKKNSILVPLRDPVLEPTFQKILQIPRTMQTKASILSFSQFRIALVLMYLTGTRVNEIKFLTKKDILHLKNYKKLRLGGKKKRVIRVAYETEQIMQYFSWIEQDIHIVFNEFQLQILGASLKNKNQGMTQGSWIRAINKHIQVVNKEYNLELALTSHSLRLGYVTRLLTENDIETVRQLVGHKFIQTTQKYTRYTK